MNVTILLDLPGTMHPNRVAVADELRQLTFLALHGRVEKWAAWLQAHGSGRPVAYVGGSRVGYVELLFATAAAGLPFAPLNYRVKPEEMARFLEIVRPGLIAAEPTYHDLLTTAGAVGRLFDPAAEPPSEPAVEAVFDPNLTAVMLFTSGTTSRPTVAALTHGNLSSYVLGTVEAGSAPASEAVLLSVPPYHIAGVTNVLSNIHRARRIVLLPQFDARLWLETIADESISHAFVVPTMLVRILDVLEGDPSLMPTTLRSLSYGGSKAPAGLVERAMRALPAGVGLINAFGLTETSSSVAVLTAEDHRTAFGASEPAVRARLDSVGRPLPGIEVVVVGDTGRPLPPGDRGEIWIRGPQVTSSGADDTGWLHSGDLGSIDDGGYLFVHGRIDDVIIRGGENIVPGEIEDVLVSHPAVAEAAVVGLPDPEWGQIVAAVVVGSRVEDDELAAWVRQHLAGFKVPTVFRWCDELPRNDLGKVVRRRAIDLLTKAAR